jgi:hypothetical protein
MQAAYFNGFDVTYYLGGVVTHAGTKNKTIQIYSKNIRKSNDTAS